MPTDLHHNQASDRERGAALLLTLLVLAILVVLVVQFAFSVKVERAIVQNTEDDAALEFAARGALPILQALFKEDRATGEPAGDIDTLADILFDPEAETARSIKVGEVTVEIEAEDAERRFPLPWLVREDRKEWAKKALERLISKIGIEGDPAGLAEQIVAEVQTLAEQAKPLVSQTQPGEEEVTPRFLFGIDQLMAPDGAPGQPAAPAPAPAEDGAAPAPAGGGGIPRLVLYGDPKADPPVDGLAYYVTTWDVPALNLNTVLPEVLWAVLPEKDKSKEPKNIWEKADEIVDAVVQRRVDPEKVTAGGEEGETPAAPAEGEGGGMGASRAWSGTPFKEVKEFESSEIHELLGAIFTKPKDSGGDGQGGGQGGQGSGSGGGQGSGESGEGQPDGEGESFELEKAFAVRSQLYFVKVTASLDSDVRSIYRMVVVRSDTDEVRALLIEEVPE